MYKEEVLIIVEEFEVERKKPKCYNVCEHGDCDAHPDKLGNTEPECQFCLCICTTCDRKRYEEFLRRFVR